MTESLKQDAQDRQLELPLGIDHAPPKVRAHGLRDAHTWPLVSRGKGADGTFPASKRVPASEAWDWPSLELRAGNTWPCLILDCDGRAGAEHLIDAIMTTQVCPPNWTVTRKASGGCHAVWCLTTPVLRGDRARERPIRAFARVSEYYAAAIDADRGYAGILSHNPMAAAHGPGLVTKWGETEPYALKTLARVIPFGWRKPPLARTEIGRNCDLFASGMKWAGSSRHLELPALLALNQDLDYPLDQAEVAGIARSVERYRRRWIAQGRFVDISPEAVSARQSRRARIGMVKRRAATAERDAAILEAVLEGQSMRSVAAAHGLNEKAVRHIVARDAPLFASALTTTLTETCPWDEEGVSRRTWYRRRIPTTKLNNG